MKRPNFPSFNNPVIAAAAMAFGMGLAAALLQTLSFALMSPHSEVSSAVEITYSHNDNSLFDKE